jgi:MFS family permease
MIHFPPALTHPKFRYLWLGSLISIAGSQMQIWAIFWHIRQLTDKPIALGILGLVRILPVILFALVGGALADTVNRRYLIFFTQTGLALIALALAILTFRGQITLWHIYGLMALQGAVAAFDLPARQALTPNLVPPHHLTNAFSMNSIANETGAIVGPALTGLIIAYWGLSYIYLINAISFAAVILALFLMGEIEQKAPPTSQPALSRSAIREGILFIRNHPIILSTMFVDFFATFFSSANTLMPFFVRDVLHVGAIEYGWLSAAQSVGAVAAGLIASQFDQIRRQGPVFLTAVLTFGLATALFGSARNFWLAFMALVLVGASDSISTIIRNTIRQLQTPDHIRGRMTSINQIFFMGGPQLGEVEAGLAAQFFGAPLAIISGGIGCVVAIGWIMWRWPQIRRFNGDEPVLAGAHAD